MTIGIIEQMKETTSKEVLTEGRVKRIVPVFRRAISFYREYPDIYIDSITSPDSNFALFFYQRVMLRAVMRYKYVYGTFTRAFSKSFLCVGANLLRCIFFPGAKLFIASGSKEQSANIAKEKIDE
nr:MAG TPA: Terminase large subunit [Caudoviricetes sp.]